MLLSNALLNLSNFLLFFACNEVKKNTSTFTCKEVKFYAIFSIFTLLLCRQVNEMVINASFTTRTEIEIGSQARAISYAGEWTTLGSMLRLHPQLQHASPACNQVSVVHVM